MRLPLVVSVIVAIAPFSAQAQQPAAAKKADKAEAATKPKIVEPAPEKKPGVLGRIFGKKPTPTPAPTPAPVVKPKPRPKPKPKPVETEEPANTSTETPVEPAVPAKPNQPETEPPKPPAETPQPPTLEPAKPGTEPPSPGAEPPKPGTEPPAAPAEEPKTNAKPGKPTKPGKPGKNSAKTPADPALDDATKYKNARAKALEDAQVKELKSKAESALADDDAHRASVNYNKALFRKIREIDSSLDAYVDKLEQAMMKRLNAEKKE